MTGDDTLFLDTNVLIYATDLDSPWRTTATAALTAARRDQVHLVVSPQIMREYVAAATRARLTGSDVTVSQIVENVRGFLHEFRLVDETAVVVARLLDLVERIPVSGKQAHDANIVATMQAHSIRRLLTHNIGDFARFAGLITVVPLV